jgi:hypothetical protein
LVKLFSIPNTWRSITPAEAAAGERKLEWRWALQHPTQNLTALVSIRNLPTSPDAGFIMVTIANTDGKDK